MEHTNHQPIYINGVGCISPQASSGLSCLLESPVSSEGNRLSIREPNYRDFIPPEMVRRMGRIIKMGVAAAKTALADAKLEHPEMIITGTGLGCIQDTEKFLATMIRNKEEFLTPTSFIQSTHNTVSAQIALMTKCHGYNFTYVHRGFSFESAILDSLMQLESDKASHILLGCADELTNDAFLIQERMAFWRRKPVDNLTTITQPAAGTTAGEGAAFFVLEKDKKESTYAILNDVSLLHQPASVEEIHRWMENFLAHNAVKPENIGLLLTGHNGDIRFDTMYDTAILPSLADTPKGHFKHLCGEYMTATGFATWLAAECIRQGVVPPVVSPVVSSGIINNILIYNQYRGINHTLILISHA